MTFAVKGTGYEQIREGNNMICDKWLHIYGNKLGTGVNCEWVDAVEVVRCKDCRWYEINELKSDGTEDKRYKPSMCVLHSRSFRDNYYCADGERA